MRLHAKVSVPLHVASLLYVMYPLHSSFDMVKTLKRKIRLPVLILRTLWKVQYDHLGPCNDTRRRNVYNQT